MYAEIMFIMFMEVETPAHSWYHYSIGRDTELYDSGEVK